MGLENVGVIDLVAALPDKSGVALVIVDGGEIVDDGLREEALNKKLLTYLTFVSSGQFAGLYPEHADRGVVIRVMCYAPPTEGMKRIKGIRDHDHPEFSLPVELEIKRVATSGTTPPSANIRPWWKLC